MRFNKYDLRGWAFLFLIIVGFIFIISLGVGSWYLARKVNYAFSYKTLVEETIHERVKTECLK